MSSKKLKTKIKVKDLVSERNEKRTLDVSNEWKELFGVPEKFGSWIIWGRSFSGKTRFAVRLATHIAEIGERVAYLSLEEGDSKSIRRAFSAEYKPKSNMRLALWCNMELEEVEKELRKQRAPQVVIIDSVQYLGINYAGYKKLRQAFPKKLFIFISHANEQKEPAGATAVKIRYDASVKILVDGFVATAFSRYGGGKAMTIWEDGAKLNVTKKVEYNGKEDETTGEEYSEYIEEV